MSKGKEYAKNTIILLIGKFATQFFTLFLLPLYTHYLLSEDYGLVDLYQTYVNLFVPVFLMCLDSAVFRFLIDTRENKFETNQIIVSSYLKTFQQALLFLIVAFVIGHFIKINYFYLLIFNVIAIMFSNVSLQICRGIGKNIVYSMSCIISACVTLLINVLLIVVFKQNAGSILIASGIANTLCTIFIVFNTKIYKNFSKKNFSKPKIKEMLKYSIPLIPNALSWWIVNVSDRTIISTIISTSANGIYTVSCKFSNILNSIFSIFTMSWQESASLHINDKDKDEFFTNMINNIYKLFVSVSLLIILVVGLFFNVLIGKDYVLSYKYIPILILANSFNVLIGLFGGIYIAKKLTKKMTSTTIISAVINLIVDLLLIKKIGLYAACLSTLIAFMSMAIYRYIDVQKYVKVKIKFSTIISTVLTFFATFAAYYSSNYVFMSLMLLFVTMFSFLSNKELIAAGINSSLGKLIKIKRKDS